MCIAKSVGRDGANSLADSKMVQALLNENLSRLKPLRPVLVDGNPGAETIGTIWEFQRRIEGVTASGRVDPASPTLRALRAGMTPGITNNKLLAIMSYAIQSDTTRYFQPLVEHMAACQINTPLRMAHFLAQVGHESGHLRYSEEMADGDDYEGRKDLGNTQPGDGPRFKGRGLIQLTGRANYLAFGTARHRDFVTGANNLLLATDPNLAVDVSCWFWTAHNLNTLADGDDLNAITKKINGGLNGLTDRDEILQRAKCLLGV